MSRDQRVDLVGPEAAQDVLAVIHESFAGRPTLDPPATALEETVESVRDALAAHGGLLARQDGAPLGALLLEPHDRLLGMRRVGLLAAARGAGTARALVRVAEQEAARRGYDGLRLIAREELPETVRFWERLGYAEAGREGPQLFLRRMLPVRLVVPDADAMHELGRRLAGVARAGDLMILTGDLGAGKTTLTQGIAAGLEVQGAVTSPTFVISRVHRPTGAGPALVHVDAYRLAGAAELDDLDLDTDLDTAVTVVEWGAGLAETLADDRLEVALHRDATGDSDVREVEVSSHGRRWFDTSLADALDAAVVPGHD